MTDQKPRLKQPGEYRGVARRGGSMTDPDLLRDLAETLDGCEWNHPIMSAEVCRRVADELERLQQLEAAPAAREGK